jgi:ABC-type nickel/cobalt efflux system permease component RcnA
VADADATRLELYKLAVEMADRTNSRRAGTNTFFFTLNAGLAAIVGIVSTVRPGSVAANKTSTDSFGLLLTAVAGLVLALAWWMLIRYYRRLNSAKFDVINKLEAHLPAKVFTDEWHVLHPVEQLPGEDTAAPIVRTRRQRLNDWMTRKRHREATLVEQVVPLVFAAIYIALGVRVLF